MADGSVEFEIRANNDDVGRTIQDTTRQLRDAAGQWENSTTQAANSSSMFGGVLQGIGQSLGGTLIGAAKQAGKAVLDFAKDCIGAASDLAEIENVVDTVFGSSAREIYDWAKQAQAAFGLTETQALRYASTLGSMLKSSGMGMAEVKEMSKTIAGLAADMASFYNLDFDTAFEKLRSGISGETEPLKQLGINLSVANLEAFALAQGIEKTYSEMSQAEQIALRYQYIMQATADAQGDFARTSDGYANSLRQLEASWDTLKTTVGKVLLDYVEPVVSALAKVATALSAESMPEKTLFDELEDIDVDFDAEIAEIQRTHGEARTLLDILNEIHLEKGIANQHSQVTRLIDALTTSIPGLYDAIQGKDPTAQIEALTAALSNNGQGVSMSAWTTALATYDSFASQLDAAMKSDNPTESIHALAEVLAKGSTISVDDWVKILETFGGALVEANPEGKLDTLPGKISALAEQLSQKTGISTDSWTVALTNFNTFKEDFFKAISSDNPGAELDALARKMAGEYPGIGVEGWRTIFGTLNSFLGSEDANLSTEGIVSKLGAMSGALAPKEINIGAWQTAISNFESIRGEFFAALASNDPGANLDALAAKLAAQYPDYTFTEWQGVIGTLATYLSSEDANLPTEGIISKLSGLSGALAPEGINTGAWNEAIAKFETIRSEFFAALSSNDPGAKLDELAKKLAAQYPEYSFTEWQDVVKALAQFLSSEDANLPTDALIEKLNGMSSALANVPKVSDVLGSVDENTPEPSKNLDAWTTILGTFGVNINGFKNALTNYPEGLNTKISNLATALSGIDGDEAKVKAWQELVGLITQNAEGLQKAMGWTEEETWNWITSLTNAVNNIDPTKAGAFEELMAIFLGGGENGKGIGDMVLPPELAQNFTGLTQAVDGTYYASAQELEVLKRLIDLFPQLSSIINVNTGEVRGGTLAIMEYVNESETAMFQLAAQKKIAAKLDAIQKRYEVVATMEVDVRLNEKELEKNRKRLEDYRTALSSMGVQFVQDENGEWRTYEGLLPRGFRNMDVSGFGFEGIESSEQLYDAYILLQHETITLNDKTEDLRDTIGEEKTALDEATKEVMEEAEALGVDTGAKSDNAAATTLLVKSEEEAAKALADLEQQLQDIIDYQEEARKSALSTLSQTVSGLREVNREAEEYNKIVNANTLQKNLESQLAFLDEYSRMMDEAKERGVSDEVLAAIADGSMESMQYLRGLANATPEEIATINSRYAQVTERKNTLASKIAAEQLSIDETYQKMIEKAQEAAAAMDQSEVAGAGATATVQAVVDAVSAAYPTLAAQVESINSLLAQIGQVGGFTVGGPSGVIIGTGSGVAVGHRAGGTYATPHALGLDYVPYDGYLAELHQGETILTADEAALWRNFTGVESANDQMAFDYDMLTASITSGVPSGGNVYLDGRTVGKVISQGQGDSFRRLQRSGWRG